MNKTILKRMENFSSKRRMAYEKKIEELNKMLDSREQVRPENYSSFDDFLSALGLVKNPSVNLKGWNSWAKEEKSRYKMLIKKARGLWRIAFHKVKKYGKKEIKLAKLIAAYPEIHPKELMPLAGYTSKKPERYSVLKFRRKHWEELLEKYVDDDRLMDKLREYADGQDKNLSFKSIVKLIEWKYGRQIKGEGKVKELVERRAIFDE